MNNQATKNLIKGQACFVFGIVICILLKPKGLTGNGGITYYGVYAKTILPYAFALLGLAWFSLRIALSLNEPRLKTVKYAGTSTAALILAVFLTPYHLSIQFYVLHVYLAAALFLVEYFLMVWMIIKLQQDWLNAAIFVLTTVELYITATYLGPKRGYLTLGQLVFQALFSVVFYRALRNFYINDQQANI